MAVEVKVPSVGESVYEVTIGEWLKAEGDFVKADEPVVALETDKASVEVPAPRAGKLQKVLKKQGESAGIGEVIGMIDEAAVPAAAPATKAAPAAAAAAPAKVAAGAAGGHVMPSARRVMDEKGLASGDVQATGPGGRVLKEDALRAAEGKTAAPAPAPAAKAAAPKAAPAPRPAGAREEEVVPMTPLRRRIAERLVESQSTAALLTTFNEVDMSAVMALRNEFKDSFLQKHGVKLGFMSFFLKATIEALKAFPAVNAEIRGTDIIYKNYYDIGVAVGGGRGLVVPVLRNAESLSFAEVEKQIAEFAERAKNNKLAPEELQGGTFTISNGGVYGSLMSTPIVNPPQVGILGMHAIQERPVARDGSVVIRPMMYVALTYDHRIIDGRESVSFLKRIKECVEHPSRMLLEV
jgi:2-oxoglutarate dehydrogenase E2 component (dihydrolipoamide succinyltransferase)